jgi:arsenate reductase (glutaredoxin)
VGLENLIDTDGKEYQKRNLKYIIHNIEEILLQHPLLFKTPIVRNGKQATVGYAPEVWNSWNE